jgi:hypothetical protein
MRRLLYCGPFLYKSRAGPAQGSVTVIASRRLALIS